MTGLAAGNGNEKCACPNQEGTSDTLRLHNIQPGKYLCEQIPASQPNHIAALDGNRCHYDCKRGRPKPVFNRQRRISRDSEQKQGNQDHGLEIQADKNPREMPERLAFFQFPALRVHATFLLPKNVAMHAALGYLGCVNEKLLWELEAIDFYAS